MPLPLIIAASSAAVMALGGNALLQKRSTLDNAFAPEKQAEKLAKHRDKVGVGEDFNYSAGAFDHYMKTKAETSDKLKDVFKDPKVQKAIKSSDTLKTILQDVVSGKSDKPAPTDGSTPPKSDIELAQEKYEERARVFGQLLKKEPPYRAEQLVQAMKDLTNEGRGAIVKQQELELKSLKAKLETTEVDTALKAGGVLEGDLAKAKEAMVKELEATHKAQLKAFDDSTQESTRKLHDAARKEMSRYSEVIYMATIAEFNDKMRAEIGRLAEKKGHTTNLIGQIGAKPDNPDIAQVKITDLETIYTRTGKKITQDKDGVLTFNMGKTWTNPLYYFLGNKPETDLELMAHHIKAQGFKGIEMDVVVNNDEIAKQRAKQCYEACINAGFDPKDITINVNGKAMKAEEIYGKGSQIPGELQKRSVEIQAKFDTVLPRNTNDLKKDLEEIVTKAKEAEKPEVTIESLPEEDATSHHSPTLGGSSSDE